MQYKATVLRKQQDRFLIENIEIGEPRRNELLVRIEAVGICRTDTVICIWCFGKPFFFRYSGTKVQELSSK